MRKYDIAQVNVGRVRAPLEDPLMAGFVERLEEINALAERTPDALKKYAYHSAHAELLRQRQQWFEPFTGAYMALWWVPVGHRPGIDEAKKRLAHLNQYGPTQFAFTFKTILPPDEAYQQGIDWLSFEPCQAS